MKKVNWWMSYADLMTGIVMIFALCLTVVIVDAQAKSDSLDATKKQLEQSKAEVAKVLGVKADIVKELGDAFAKNNMKIDIDKQTGAIRLPGSVLFGTNSTEISPQGMAYLQKFVPVYFSVLLQPKFKDQISSIMIEGHTDHQGSYMYNMQLSQERAFSVLSYIYGDKFPNFPEKNESQSIVTCDGWSYSKPLSDPNLSRRVEFSFRLKDEDTLNEIEKLVSHS